MAGGDPHHPGRRPGDEPGQRDRGRRRGRAGQHRLLLILGLAISIPLIIFGSTLLMKLMERFPIIITLGAALLGFLAGEMFVTDPSAAAMCFTANAAAALTRSARPARCSWCCRQMAAEAGRAPQRLSAAHRSTA